ncbi:P-loop containing nucleoside triphosphate hydrolase protein [Spinellus fusiger]|nr:P-loop containing nucleoside triphosphate hydrolase protein [Spinellus fusiger]
MKSVYILGISGPSCSGKTTLTKILHRLLKNSVVIYQDDYFKTDDQIPMDPATQLANWDCPDAIDFPALIDTIHYARTHQGELPFNKRSQEIHNAHDGALYISAAMLSSLEAYVSALPQGMHYVLVDGFMLYGDSALYAEFDKRLFITASYDTLKQRRESRTGYTTIEGFWADPPGYFDMIVWPQFLKWNKHLFASDSVNTIAQNIAREVLVIDTDQHSIDTTANIAVQAFVQALTQ